MRVLALACLVAAVASEELQLGYGLGNGDLQFDLPTGSKTVTRQYSLTIPSEAQFNGQAMSENNNWVLSLRLYVSALDCAGCINSVITMNYLLGNTAPTATDPMILSAVSNPTGLSTDGIWANIPLPSIPAGSSQKVNFLLNITCAQCSKSAELSRLEAIVRYIDSATPTQIVFGSFVQDSDRNTDKFGGAVGTWGPVVRLSPDVVASDYVILVQEINIGAGVVYYFARNATAFASGIATYDPSTLLCAMSNNCSNIAAFTSTTGNFLRTPAASYGTGEFPSQSVPLGSRSAGTWYVAPFVTRKATGLTTSYRFAIGFNAEPAAAAGLVPSFIVVAFATLFAALRV